MKLMPHPLPPHNPRTVCPPGVMQPGSAALILVPSLQRSGTHLLIDTILNNFALYKRRPLYVDIDHLLDDPTQVDRLITCGNYVVKTHFPQVGDTPLREAQMRRVIACSKIVSPQREDAAVYQSSLAFGTVQSRKEFEAQKQRFQQFWGELRVYYFTFARLVDRNNFGQLVNELSNVLEMPANSRLVLPYEKRARLKVYTAKLLTRLLGNRAPLINTTIGFAKHRSVKRDSDPAASVLPPRRL